jgi:hypothetical protein
MKNLASSLAIVILLSLGQPALAAPPRLLGEPFGVRQGQSVELASGVNLKFIGVTSDSRCPIDVTCVWQGEAVIEIELQAHGRTARGSISTVKTDLTLLAHRVKLLGLYPSLRESEKRPAEENVAFFRVVDPMPTSTKGFANRAAAQAAAVRYVDAFARSAKQVCTDWQQRRLASYIQDSGGLCQMISKTARTAHAVSEDAGGWRFFFLIDNPQLREQMNETVYLFVAISKVPENAVDQVGEFDVVILPCDVTLLDETAHGGCNAPWR